MKRPGSGDCFGCHPRLTVGWQFDGFLYARVMIEDWWIDYNVNRPNTAHGELSPSESAAKWTTINQPQAA